eukprot:3840652-Rhodomonas_salina.1
MIPWSISHWLPARVRRSQPGRQRHRLHPIVAPGSSLLRNLVQIHSFNLVTERYRVTLTTSATSLHRWGRLEPDALGRALRTAPPIFIPAAGLPSHARTPSGLWWHCTGFRLAPARKVGPIRYVFDGRWVGPSACTLSATFTHADMDSLLHRTPIISPT